MNILVTGGCGFIGSNFIRNYLLEGNSSLTKLVNIDKLTYAGNNANLSDVGFDSRYLFVQGDIGDKKLVANLLSDYSIQAVVNFAAESHVDRSIDSPEPFFQTNVIGTLRLLESVTQYWRGLSEKLKKQFRFSHISTDEVYGTLHEGDLPWNEDCAHRPNSPYAASKSASDDIVRAFNRTYSLPTIITNCSNNYGPYQFPEKLIPLIILNAIEGKMLPVYGDGLQIRDWLYVADHVSAIRTALIKGQVGETYNVGGNNEMRNIDIVKQICKILDEKCPKSNGKSYETQIVYVADRPGHDRRYAIDCAKITRNLDWVSSENFDTGLDKTVSWYISNREWVSVAAAQKYNRERLGEK